MRKLIRILAGLALLGGLVVGMPDAKADPLTLLGCEVAGSVTTSPGVNNVPSDGHYTFVQAGMACEGLHGGDPLAVTFDVDADGDTTGDPLLGNPGDGEDCDQGRSDGDGHIEAHVDTVLGGSVPDSHRDLYGNVRFTRVGTTVLVDGELWLTAAKGAPGTQHFNFTAQLQFIPSPVVAAEACALGTTAITDADLVGTAEVTD